MSTTGKIAIAVSISALILAAEGCSKKDQSVADAVKKPAATGTATTMSAGAGLEGGSKSGAALAQVAKQCFSLSFSHIKTKGHASDEECSRHRNMIVLPHPGIHIKSLCVKIDGTPVRSQISQGRESTKITIGPIAGPSAIITADYCLGSVKCNADCRIPKDEFMEALGASEDDGASHATIPKTRARKPAAKWDKDDATPETDLAAEIGGDVMKELADDSDLGVFDGWHRESISEKAACRS
ncbi:MAG: hypothetical protein A2583_09825 [Bdellovibrionales bacterium RIFOXYD1_FULL_53_11]|nr:MAG: hypothetical protein A2583_09825 [Bdellovibrionales bacterium RIFOXYD1_FULL_53_11]